MNTTLKFEDLLAVMRSLPGVPSPRPMLHPTPYLERGMWYRILPEFLDHPGIIMNTEDAKLLREEFRKSLPDADDRVLNQLIADACEMYYQKSLPVTSKPLRFLDVPILKARSDISSS
jgi:hypothetical protein